MSTLRQRLADEGFSTGTWSEPSEVTPAIEVEEALAVFVAFLREQAEALRADSLPHPSGKVGDLTQIMVKQTAKYLDHVLADSIEAGDL